jgi:hypothetical protein
VAGCADVLVSEVVLDRNFISPQVLVAQVMSAMASSASIVLVDVLLVPWLFAKVALVEVLSMRSGGGGCGLHILSMMSRSRARELVQK